MEIENVINVPFYKFVAPLSLQKEVLENVETLNYVNLGGGLNVQYYPNYFHEKLFDFFDQSLKEIQTIYFKDNLSFPIVDCWVHKSSTYKNLHKHSHANSIISGIYYVTDHGDYGATVFEIDNLWDSTYNRDQKLQINKGDISLKGEVSAEAGKLILFPSSIKHYMKTITKKSITRYTIAFNAYVSGEISNHETARLFINAESIRDKLKLHK